MSPIHPSCSIKANSVIWPQLSAGVDMNIATRFWGVFAVLAVAGAMPAWAGSQLIIPPQTAFAMRVIAAHNQLRAPMSVQLATWDPGLAQAAGAYAMQLVRKGGLAHSRPASRPEQGENLWMGTRGAFSVERMVADWGSERRMFRPGQFPLVSATGRWEDVGHYTQIIWPSSTRIGCAVRSSATNDFLVCRYGEGGNVFGQRVGLPALASR